MTDCDTCKFCTEARDPWYFGHMECAMATEMTQEDADEAEIGHCPFYAHADPRDILRAIEDGEGY